MFKGKYNELVSHQTMIQDETRTQGYMEAIEKAVDPGDTVIDFGSGTGILAIKAAKCGANKVWAIERNPVTAMILRKNILSNNVDVEVFEGTAAEFIIMHHGEFKADVVISECIGDHIFENTMVLDFHEICKHFYATKCIPSNFKLYCHGEYITRKQDKFDNAKDNLAKHDINLEMLNEELFPNAFLDTCYFENNDDNLDYYFKFIPSDKEHLLFEWNNSATLLNYEDNDEIIKTSFTMDKLPSAGDYLMLYWDIDLFKGTMFTNRPSRKSTKNHSYFQRTINVSSYVIPEFNLGINILFDKIANEDTPCNNIKLLAKEIT
tara:strand:+ start:501 stop:1463 length:963 start_codon:yes stop_codon:yes gene_type:complete